MQEISENNKIFENNNEPEDLEFSYNFINTPWDDRSNKSKTFIIVLLISIFVATMGLVINNFHIHYKGFESTLSMKSSDISCYRLRIDALRYVARLHSATTFELLCLGAVVSPTSILTNGVCVRFGRLRMYIGSVSDPRCRKGFSVDVAESINHPGVVSNRLVLLSSYENIKECSDPITIGHELDWDAQVHIIGRPFAHGRALSRQHVSLAEKDFGFERTGYKKSKVNHNYTIIGKELSRCPVRAGDLMLQDGKLFGLAAYQRNKLAFFAALDPVKSELKEIDADIMIDKFQSRYTYNVKFLTNVSYNLW